MTTVVELDRDELVVLMLEASTQQKRPPDRSASEVLDALKLAPFSPDFLAGLARIELLASVALEYFGRCTVAAGGNVVKDSSEGAVQ
jgi:hypothetical protein